MKKRTIIEEFSCNDCKTNSTVACELCFKEHSTVEQVPETFEELKELCKNLDKKLVKEGALYETQITMETDKGYYAFYQDGTIIFKASNSINYTVATNRTIPQLWAFIKSLIGE